MCSHSLYYDMTHCLMGAPLYYLTLAEYGRCPKLSHYDHMNDALRKGAWDKGCTDIMYV